MKPSEYSKLAGLVKNYIEEEKNWLGRELPVEKEPVAKASAPKGRDLASPCETGQAGGDELEEFRKVICGCQKCPLGKSRINFVFGVGNPRAELMFVGEGPGFDEDHKGEPFIGRAGQQLNKIIAAMGFQKRLADSPAQLGVVFIKC